MKTPALIEWLFQIDARAAAKQVCSAWITARDHADCMLRQYPQEMSDAGVLVLKIMAAVVICGMLYGFRRAWRERNRDLFVNEPYLFGRVLGRSMWRGAWQAWMALASVAFVVLLVQVLLA